MMLLQIQQLTKYFGAELILSNIKLEIQLKDRIALVGRNGAGKSTLLKMIAGQLSYDSGQIVKPKDVSIGYLAQNTGLESTLSIWDEMLSVFDSVRKMEKDIRNIEQELSNPANYEQAGLSERLLREYDQLQVKFKDIGGYQYESDIRSVLHGLRFYEKDYSSLISTLSGGQKTRLALAKLLLTKPDILILDEPTNHLDIETLSWLEQYLQSYSGAILIVSHDRYFLDKVVTQVYELSRHELKKFHGNYSKYLTQKAEIYERELKQFEKQQDEVAKLQDFIQKNLARASTTKRAQSRRKQLEKMEMLDRPMGGEKSASFAFGIEKQSGNDVLKITDAVIGYGQTSLSNNINFSISRHDSIALVGPNGVGKSTLLKTIIKKLPLLAGSIGYGSNVTIGYYDQEQAELSSNKTVLQELWDQYPHKDEKEIRTVLGNFLFSGDDVQKIVSTLSGGEKARVALAILMLEQANFLILDEPTNHLDLDSKEVLENALVDYPGTILFVSHDRYFINRLATIVVELSPEGTKEYLGDYDYYVEKKAEMLELARLDAEEGLKRVEAVAQSNKNSYQQDKEIKRLERQRKRRIEEIEEKLSTLEEQLEEKEEVLCRPDIFEDHEQVMAINECIEEIKAEIDKLLEEWTELSELLQI
ncbi:ABC-F family ATP-binding cassette domain-containing protein [Lederbergia citrea]|uniref:ABC-F family ATP-binding cassette domain-containing protein n=1 Tax=Lederbergia citrea TaxID=2833581 RepID=UPI001BCA4322|nr:ABC-F family ATP-binding cassette domain-containing protein [Lederbergia citrea]MBS4179606.1 ABC-F family ATP-binding cassette domain-containing protein [Lederbergia citrea]MBS4206273.1 ABC-F family ATP-binding cassette domain-containing protein [Lederbergia citrea]